MMNKKKIVITGANSNIGKMTAIALANKKHKIIMVCRNKQRGEKALIEIKSKSGHEDVELMICDLSSFQNIIKFSEQYKKDYKDLDILINNAGIMNHQREISQDGFEMHFQVNYLGPVLLTQCLLDVINPGGRIINVASLAHRVGKINFSDINLTNNFSMVRAYAQSKLALMLYSCELSKRIEKQQITINTLHPGIIVTNLGIYQEKKWIRFLANKIKWMFSSPQKGAETIVYLADSSDVAKVSGKHFYHKKLVKSAKKTYNKTLRKQLWNYTEEIMESII